ncbi:hypothetical protein M0R45_012200 [Rubus argutus]|uniref:FAD dependent oxidoreductase domain-containing protein n=1 Tax=Rubus argutus TaxID=59490 RepID=A0AAW1YGQ1_RUBAR
MESSDQEFDVIVIGAGIMGSSTAIPDRQAGSQDPPAGAIRLPPPPRLLPRRVPDQSGPRIQRTIRSFGTGVVTSCGRRPSRRSATMSISRPIRRYSGRIKIPEGWVGLVTEHGGLIKPTKAVCPCSKRWRCRTAAVLRDNMEVMDMNRDEAKGGIWVKVANGERFLGVTSAWSCWGLDKEVAVHGGYPCDPDKRPWGPGISLSPLKEWIDRTFSGVVDSGGPVATQLCMYSMTPDEDFVIDFLGASLGRIVVIGAGFSVERQKEVELKHFKMARFQENPKGNVKDFLHKSLL